MTDRAVAVPARPIVIVGFGGLARRMPALIDAVNGQAPRYRLLGYLDSAASDRSADALGHPLLGGDDQLDVVDADYVVGIGSGAARRRVDDRASRAGRRPASLVHPAAILEAPVDLGAGAAVHAGACVQANARLGRHVLVNVHAVVGHDCVVGNYVSVAPQAVVGGGAALEDGVTLGACSVVVQGVRVGAGSTIGAGAVVTRDVPPGVTAVGVPARALERPHRT